MATNQFWHGVPFGRLASASVTNTIVASSNQSSSEPIFLDWAESKQAPKNEAQFSSGQTVRVVAPGYVNHDQVAVVREVRRIASIADAVWIGDRMGDPFYLIEYADSSTVTISESRLERFDTAASGT